jgi:dienelactone hydrolase
MPRTAILGAMLLLLAAQDAAETGTSASRPLAGPSAASVARFELPAEPFSWTLTPSAELGGRGHLLTFPSAVKTASEANNTVTCKVWLPKDEVPAPRPAVVLLHYLRGRFKPMEDAARYFASKGFVAVLVYMPHYGPRASPDPAKKTEMIGDHVEDTVANFRQAVLDIRRAGDWLRSRKDVDKTRVGLFGVSLGSVVGALVAGADTRFTQSVFVVGGGHLPSIVLNESRETKAMRQRLLDGGWTAEKLEKALETIEPLRVGARVNPAGVLMVNALDDQVVPRSCTDKLIEVMGRPKVRWIKADHYTIAIALLDILKDAAEHLSRRPRT